MDCFIKKIWNKTSDEFVHSQFTRFGKGEFKGRAALTLRKADKIKIGGSFELVNDFADLCCEFEQRLKFSGIILSKEDISDLLRKNNIESVSEEKKGGLFYKNTVSLQEINSSNLLEIIKNSYYCLIDIEGKDFTFKSKKNLPKPGKSGDLKIDDKFCLLEADLKYWLLIKNAFVLPECKKASISHTYVITELVFPKGEKDFARIRELAKRKGKIIRKLEVDKKESSEEMEFEA